MNERAFSRRRRGGHRFRPSGGMNANNKRATKRAAEARTQMLQEQLIDEPVFDLKRHRKEIDRAENIAAGLPPETTDTKILEEQNGEGTTAVEEETSTTAPESPALEDSKFEPVPLAEPAPTGLVSAIRTAANKVIKKVTRLIQPANYKHKEIIVNAESLETRVAVVEDGLLEEFTIERKSDERLVGSIFKGKVKNLEDGLKAAFVAIGFEKNAFLHYWDIVPNNFDSNIELVERPNRRKERPKVTQRDIPRLYPPGTDIIVQVTKGPIGNKGPRVTTNLALPGRYLVLLPNSDQCGISRKIENTEERQRLKKIVRSLTIPDGMGVIIRTAGDGQQARYFVRDLAILLDEWRGIQARINRQPAATCVFQEPDLIERTVRDFLTEDVDRIVVDNHKEYERIQEIITKISKRSSRKVKPYAESQPVFDRFNITRQLDNTLSRQVHLKSGGYIVIDETEAMVAIDVNTGRHKSIKDQDSTIVKVNLEAVEEICRQLRLRNIGGLVVLDFIDMKTRRDQLTVTQKMKEALKRDRAKTHVLPISPLGLMEMTRQRHTESVRSSVYDDCPYCSGRGKVKSSLTMSVEIQRRLSEILKKRERDESDFQLRIVVNPTVLSRLRKEDEEILIEMEKTYFGKLSFRSDASFHPEQFKIYNAATNELLISVGENS